MMLQTSTFTIQRALGIVPIALAYVPSIDNQSLIGRKF